MAAANGQAMPPQAGHHQRTKSSVLRSFMMYRRDNVQGDGPAAALPVAAIGPARSNPLEEASHNRQQPHSRAPAQTEKHPMAPATTAADCRLEAASSPTKKTKLAREPLAAIQTDLPDVNSENEPLNSPPPSPTKKSRPRSTTNFSGLLSRPKSFKNLRKMAKDGETEGGNGLDEEQEPDRGRRAADEVLNASVVNRPQADAQMTPIYAQFCTTGKAAAKDDLAPSKQPSPSTGMPASGGRQWPTNKPRPQSSHPASAGVGNRSTRQTPNHGAATPTTSEPPMSPDDINTHLEALLDRRNIPEHQRYKMRSLADGVKMELIRQDWAEERSKRQHQQQSVDGVPNRNNSVGSANDNTSDRTYGSNPSTTPSDGDSTGKATKSKHSRVKSMTLSKVTRGRSRDRASGDTGKRYKSPGSPLKRKVEGTLGRHLRSKSTESLVNVSSGGDAAGGLGPALATGAGGSGSAISGFFTKAKGPQQNSPADFVSYLRTVQTPEKVEVGKLHKLRLLLRNETVAWIEDFIGQGGMQEVVGLLHRILAVEWREEHEDALLHENLLCLKALCTTALALQYLHSIHASLLPALIHMIFDPEKKGPSEFTTRNIVTWVLFTYIQSAPAHERPSRAQTVLSYLRDPERDEEKPVSFVLEMRKERPYRVWCKEVVNVTKEVFWIFLHHLNVVSLPDTMAKEPRISPMAPVDDSLFCTGDQAKSDLSDQTGSSSAVTQGVSSAAHPPVPPKHTETTSLPPSSSYLARHFPRERPPVPAAPYVGGVEWEATNYLASHLDLLNAIVACIPTAAERNHLRSLMQMSGWERCMGRSLRLCKEKFYGSVHDGLRVWVAAAYEDGWDVRDVRYGPPPPPPVAPASERRSNSPKKAPVVGGAKADEPAPKLEIPKLDFVLDSEAL